jgi:AhpD family alkylhydroperoxidase
MMGSTPSDDQRFIFLIACAVITMGRPTSNFLRRTTMMNWLDYRKKLMGRIGEIGKLSPDTLAGYQTLSKAGQKTGHLDAKTRELIALAVSVTSRCDGCITVHTSEALKHGATREEIAEALGVAVALNAGAAMVYSARVMDAVSAYSAPAMEQAP